MHLEEVEDSRGKRGHVAHVVQRGGGRGGELLGQLALQLADEVQVGEGLDISGFRLVVPASIICASCVPPAPDVGRGETTNEAMHATAEEGLGRSMRYSIMCGVVSRNTEKSFGCFMRHPGCLS